MIKDLRGQGRGLRSNFVFDFILLILKIWNMWVQELFTELKKLAPLLRCVFSRFQVRFSEIFQILSPKSPKNPKKKVKIPKVCFVQIFCLTFVCNLAKNGLVWLFWPKVICFFRFRKSNFFAIFPFQICRNCAQVPTSKSHLSN